MILAFSLGFTVVKQMPTLEKFAHGLSLILVEGNFPSTRKMDFYPVSAQAHPGFESFLG